MWNVCAVYIFTHSDTGQELKSQGEKSTHVMPKIAGLEAASEPGREVVPI